MSSQAMAPIAYPTSALDRGLRLIQIARDEGKLRVIDAANELGVARSSAHRLLQALVYRDFLVQDEDHNYLPGPALSAGTADLAWSRGLRETATPHMERLVDLVGNASNLMIRVDSKVRFLYSVTVEGGTYDRRGSIMTAHRTAGGKALLSTLDDATLEEMYLVTDQNGMSKEQFDRLMKHIDGARREDFALAQAELERSVSAVGTVIRDEHGEHLGALTISTRSPRIAVHSLTQIIGHLHDSRSAIERDLHGLTAP